MQNRSGYLPSSENDPSCFIDKEVSCKGELLTICLILSLFYHVILYPCTEGRERGERERERVRERERERERKERDD